MPNQAMSSQARSSWKASTVHNAGAATMPSAFSAGPSSTMSPRGNQQRKKPAARKPKRTSFTCLVCRKTFPSQQAMAGHCSAHTRAGGARRVPVRQPILLPAGPVAAAAAHPPLLVAQCHGNLGAGHCVLPQQVHVAVRYVPYTRPISNQMVVRLPYLQPHGRQSSMSPATMDLAMYPALYPPSPAPPAATQFGWGTYVPIYSLPPSSNLNGAATSEMSSTNPPPDKTLRLGSGSNHHQKSTTLPLLGSLMAPGGRQGADRKGKSVIAMESGASNSGDDATQGLDLELHLYR